MDSDTVSEKNIISKYNTNFPYLGINYRKTMSYVLNYDNNIYYTHIFDERVQFIEKINLKITLPEIIGKGTIAYKKYFQYHLIKSIEISYKNPNEDEILLIKAENDELLMNLLSKQNANDYFNHCGGIMDKFCIETEGTYNDCVIFPERNIEIPIDLLIPHIKIFPKTTIIFRIELNPLQNMLIYNTIFEKKSLENYINKNINRNLNFKLEFDNTIIFDNNDIMYSPIFFLRKKKTIGQYNSNNLNSQEFKNCFCIKVLTKSDIFTNNNRFIINPPIDTNEDKIIDKWILKILKDLIIITEDDLTDNKIKQEYGYDKEAEFVKVENNTVKFNNDVNKFCKIYIESVPESCNIYYHKNILTYSRRYMFKDVINISEMFKYISGICISEDNLNIKILEVKHNISIDYVSIPVNIWSHVNNTSPGDLRSSYSKTNDYIYNNEFILGLDYLSKDKGYNDIKIIAGRDVFDNLTHENIFNDNLKPYKISEYDINNYKNISFINFSSFRKCIMCDESINFTRFLIKINWKKYTSSDPKELYNLSPYIYLYELMVINYDQSNNNIYLKPID
jgi:hypothetical protein